MPGMVFGESELAWLAKHEYSHLKKIAIAGSCGKSTVLDLVGAILRLNHAVLVADTNVDPSELTHAAEAQDEALSSDIGMDHSLRSLKPAHDMLVLELGVQGVGDLANSANNLRSDVSLVTGVGEAYLPGLPTLEAIASEMGEFYDALPKDGCAVVNFDDDFASQWLAKIKGKSALTYSIYNIKPADVLLMQARYVPGKGSYMSIKTPKGRVEVKTHLLGEHNWSNVLAAVTAVLPFDVSLGDIAKGIATVMPAKGRLQVQAVSVPDWLMINDTEHANPISVRSAIDLLATCRGWRVLVLGCMSQVGAESARLHRAAGQYARERLIDDVIAVGPCSTDICSGFGGGQAFESHEDAIAFLNTLKTEPCAFVVKGSRGAEMEKVLKAFAV